MSHARSLHALLFYACCLVILPLPSVAVPAGGNGGESFDMDCPQGQFLVGISGTTGWYVDEIRIFCGQYDASGTFVEDSFNPQGNAIAGLPGNENYSQVCNASQVVTGFSGLAGAYVDAIASTCTETDGSDSNILGPAGGLGGAPFIQSCPPGQVATGVNSRAGWWIDQVEIQCGDFCVTPPDGIQALSPQNNAEGLQPTFAWTPASFEVLIGVKFQLCVFTSPFESCNVLDEVVNGTVFTPSQPLDFQGQPLLGWAVRSLNTCGEAGEFSTTRTLYAPGQGDGEVVETPTGPDYRPLCRVYKDARCSVCHGGPTPDGHPSPFPAQNDAQARFEDDDCTGCHHVVHPDNDNTVWEFPPGLSEEVTGADLQTFADPATCGDICRSVRNWAERGDHDFLHHIRVDPLVAYGFDPALVQANDTLAQKPPVQEMDHAAYIDLSESWYRAGMPCDPINDDFPGSAVSPAAAGDGGDDSEGKGLPPVPGDKLKVPDTGWAWWMSPKPLKPDLGKLPPQKGMPPECAGLVRQPAHPALTPQARKQQLAPGKFGQPGELRKLCKELLAR